jgi:actin
MSSPFVTVIDNGSQTIKAGVSSMDEVPRAVISSVVGKSRMKNPDYLVEGQKSLYVGDLAIAKRGLMNLSYPIERGVVTNWDDMEKVWQHTFSDALRISAEEHPVLLTEPPLNSQSNREKLAEVMFETFKVPALYATLQALLSLYASGRTTGLVVDSGFEISHTVPIHEGQILNESILKLDLAGKEVTDCLLKLLNERGFGFTTFAEKESVHDIKEKNCFVALNFEDEKYAAAQHSDLEKSYELPDGQVITVKNERFQAPEVLFHPSLIGLEQLGVHRLAYESIVKCDMALREELCSNVVISGGSTLFPGFAERLSKELLDQGSLSKIMVNKPTGGKFSAWFGGAILSTLPTFQDMLITKAEYIEFGASVIHRKFPSNKN